MSSGVKRALGRGLADLIPVGDSSGAKADFEPDREAPIGAIHAHPHQPRTHFDEAALAELAESIRANGILQPILVRPRNSGGYEIVAGERRYRAALRVGLTKVPIVVRELSDEETLALALIENLIREDIGPLETARAFRRLMGDFGWTQDEMGKRVGKSRSAVANALRLLTLPDAIQRSVEAGELTEGHARTLIGDDRQRGDADFADRQLRIWRQIVARGLSVRETERLMRDDKVADAKADTATEKGGRAVAIKRVAREEEIALRAIEDRVRDALGTRVRLIGTPERGRIEIEFYSSEEFDGLLEKLRALS